jgi:hypothetical protein
LGVHRGFEQFASDRGYNITPAVSPTGRVFSPFGRPEIVTDRPTAHETQCIVAQFGQPNADAKAQFIAAAYNAFDSASRRLGCNPVQLAEAMKDGVLLADVLDNADAILYHTPHLDRPAFEKVTSFLGKVKGGAA